MTGHGKSPYFAPIKLYINITGFHLQQDRKRYRSGINFSLMTALVDNINVLCWRLNGPDRPGYFIRCLDSAFDLEKVEKNESVLLQGLVI